MTGSERGGALSGTEVLPFHAIPQMPSEVILGTMWFLSESVRRAYSAAVRTTSPPLRSVSHVLTVKQTRGISFSFVPP